MPSGSSGRTSMRAPAGPDSNARRKRDAAAGQPCAASYEGIAKEVSSSNHAAPPRLGFARIGLQLSG